MAESKHDKIVDDVDLQVTSNGQLRHFLTMRGLERQQIIELLDRSQDFVIAEGQAVVRSTALRGKTVANLFFEPSTRTRASFDLAGRRLGADVLNLDVNTSSRKKGESILDMIYTLQAMHVDVFVVRDAEAGISAFIARHVNDYVSVLNAGEAHVSHPTQALLDLLTIRQHKGRIEGLTVAIVGDIAHSRVARSISEALVTMNVGSLRLVSPKTLAPDAGSFPAEATITADLDEGIAGADVVMALRIQRERIVNLDGIPGIDEYFSTYGVSHKRMTLAAKDAIVMHPGPMNRGIEIESSLADSPCSVIREQVRNGVAVRMAVLSTVVESQTGLYT